MDYNIDSFCGFNKSFFILDITDNKFYLGLVFLFGIEHGELRAIIQDVYLNKMATGATGALGVKYLAREDAKTVGIIGSGFQAQGQLKAVSTVRNITGVKVFSPTPKNREAFARTMSAEIGAEVRPVSCRLHVSGLWLLVPRSGRRS